MKLATFYRSVIAAGTAADPRPRKLIREELARRKTSLEKLDESERELHDDDCLFNPYSDTRVLYGDDSVEVGRVMVGIDIDAGELSVADRLRQKGEKIDLVLAHHPSGRALAGLHDVMRMQIDVLHSLGVPISTAEGMMEGRVKEIERRLLPANHNRAADAARLLDIPLMCAHTPADNLVSRHLHNRLSKEKPHRLGEIIDLLLEEPEYREGARNGVRPRILLGSKERRAGNVILEMTGGTSGAKEAFAQLANRGVDTIVGMHISDDYRKEAKKHHLNVIIAGHISSDTLGMNLLMDSVSAKAGGLEVVAASGFQRFERS
jgi:hypothetical protein